MRFKELHLDLEPAEASKVIRLPRRGPCPAGPAPAQRKEAWGRGHSQVALDPVGPVSPPSCCDGGDSEKGPSVHSVQALCSVCLSVSCSSKAFFAGTQLFVRLKEREFTFTGHGLWSDGCAGALGEPSLTDPPTGRDFGGVAHSPAGQEGS